MERPWEPQASPYAYETFQVRAPLATHWRPATCQEIDCEQYRNGWAVHVEQVGPELAHAARTSGRRFDEHRIGEGQTYLVFEPGQQCFESTTHTVRLEREELYVLRGGDWRGNPSGQRHDLSPTSWTDAFGANQESLADEARRG